MFLAFLVAGTLLAFGGIALASGATPTGSKVLQGDNVFVPPAAVGLVDPNNAQDVADLARFMTGFLNPTVKVNNVIPAAGTGTAVGSVIGLNPPVRIQLANVTLIERDGQTFS